MSGADCLFSQTPRIGMFHLSSAAKLLQVDDGNCKSGIIVKVMLSLFEFVQTSETWSVTNPANCACDSKRICKQYHIHTAIDYI